MGRRRQGSKPDGRDSARGAGYSPRAHRRNAGMSNRFQSENDTEAQMEHNVATELYETLNGQQ